LDAGGELRPQVRAQMDDLLKRIDTAIADAKTRPVDPVVNKETPLPSVKNPDPSPTSPVTSPATDTGPGPGPKTPDVLAALPALATPHYATLRDAAERSVAEKRAAAAAFFHAGAPKSAFHHAAGVFLSRDEASWKLDGAVAAGLKEYLGSPEL